MNFLDDYTNNIVLQDRYKRTLADKTKINNSKKKRKNNQTQLAFFLYFLSRQFAMANKDCAGVGQPLYGYCFWEFTQNDTCDITKCSRYFGNKEWRSWSDCSANCCTLDSFTRQSVVDCIKDYNLRLGLGLGIGFSYPIVAFIIFFFVKYDSNDSSKHILISIFWPFVLIAGLFAGLFYLLYELCKHISDWCEKCCLIICPQRRVQPQIRIVERQVNNTQQFIDLKNEVKNLKSLVQINEKNQKITDQSKQAQKADKCTVCCVRKRNAIGDCMHRSMCCFQCTIEENITRCPISQTYVIWRKILDY